ncbi:heparinase II/III family protein [Arthrobacter sp. ISL-30]|nr:heparinase II/III family protein [Arthrobacter sp. ISL-30]
MSSLSDARRRLSVRPAGDPAWEAVDSAALQDLAATANAERGTPWPQPLVSHYARYFRDGNRTEYEDRVAARQQRLTHAVVMAAIAASRESSGDGTGPDWLDEVIDGAYLLCEQSSWCWAAHDDIFKVTGAVVPDPAVPYLDLGAGEVAAQLAWLDLVLGDRLDERAPGLRQRIRTETHERVFTPFLDRLDWHWLGLHGDVHNWNPWIHSNILAAALFLLEDSAQQSLIVERVIEGLDRFLASIPPDGAIDEGFAYWWNGAGRALEALALLDEGSAGVLDGDLPVVRELVAFPHRMHLGHNWFLNVADGPARAWSGMPWDMLHRWAVRLDNKDAVRHAEAFRSRVPWAAAGLGRVLHALLTSVPASMETATPPLTGFTYLPSVQIMVARETPGSVRGLALAAKGGHNGEHHNHRDVGSVVVAVDGVPLLVDAGQPTYTAQTFGPDRYGIRAMQSSWHSVPAPFGLEQGTGKEFGASVLRTPTAEEPTLALELAGAYGLANTSSWIRAMELDRASERLIIEDRWTALQPAVSGSSGEIDIHYLLAGNVNVTKDSVSVRPDGIPTVDGGRGAVLRWDPASAVVRVDEWLLDDPLLSEVWGTKLTRLRFRLPAELRNSGSFILTVEAIQ